MSALLEGSPYQGYAYAYPHKTAYRPLDPPRALSGVWAEEPRDAVFLYLHVPFCEMRCGFCNLFTAVEHDGAAHARTVAAIERQAEAVDAAVGPVTVAQVAIGGGTPTLLAPRMLERALAVLGRFAALRKVPWSIETSPATAEPERLAVLQQHGVQRVSIGVQSFVEEEARGAGRPQRTAEVEAALHAIRDAGPVELNIDLMYGLPHQTAATFRESLDRALAWAPEELFLYPLYVRPRTGLHRTGRAWDDHRLALYHVGRDHLLARGYHQRSMRLFRQARARTVRTPYRCQADGMLGLGPGARSYTRSLHYATEWGVGRERVRSIVAAFEGRTAAEHATADHGIILDREEQQRRHVIQSLLCDEGLERSYYRSRFGTEPESDLPQLHELAAAGLAEERDGGLHLTARGLERSDAIGPWLASPAVRDRMRGYALQ